MAMIRTKLRVAAPAELDVEEEIYANIKQRYAGVYRLDYEGRNWSTNQREYRIVFDDEAEYTMFLLRYSGLSLC